MRFGSIVAGLGVLLIVDASAGEQQQTRLEIAIEDDSDGHQSFVFDSKDAGFDLDSMLVGESRSVTDRAGNMADLRRTEDGFELDFDDNTIELPDLQGHDAAHAEHDVEVRMGETEVVEDIRKVKIVRSDGADAVTIISGRTIEDATRERIADVLRDAGHSGGIHYIDDSRIGDGANHAGGERKVRVIRKEVDVTN